jgi:hypothetical protein
LEKFGKSGFAERAECETGERDSELDARHDAMKIRDETFDDFGSGIPFCDKLTDAGQTHGNQREFGSREKSVEQDENKHANQANDKHSVWMLLRSLDRVAVIFEL